VKQSNARAEARRKNLDFIFEKKRVYYRERILGSKQSAGLAELVLSI
jgi:hypothetical protein